MADKPSRQRRFVSYDRIAQFIDGIAPELRAQGFSAVAGIMRGGIFPAQCASYAAGIPLSFIHYERVGSKASWVGCPPAPGKILLCEDIAGMGVTLSTCQEFLKKTHPLHEVLAVASDELSRVKPRWSMRFDGVQVVFPWERHVSVPRFMEHWSAGGARGDQAMDHDHDYRFFAVVLDGVMALPGEAGCAQPASGLQWAPWAPKISPSDAVVLTERPLCEAAEVRAWLARHGWAAAQVLHAVQAPCEDAGAAKARAMESMGCTDILEACPIQALLISQAVAHARVHWWREGSPILVSAAASSGV